MVLPPIYATFCGCDIQKVIPGNTCAESSQEDKEKVRGTNLRWKSSLSPGTLMRKKQTAGAKYATI